MQIKGLTFKAGPAAFADIKKRGFAAERIGTLAGASGGAKWLVLSQVDRVIIERLLPRLSGPVHLIGSSIGAWRFACYGQLDPLRAIERFESAYIEQSYSDKPDRDEITDKSRAILQSILGDTGAAEIVSHSQFRTHVMTVRSRFLTATDNKTLLASGLLAAGAANVVSRKSLGAFFRRGLFYDPRALPPFYNAVGFPLDRIRLTQDNLKDAVVASGSIPLVLNGVRNIHGAPPGIYRDGGVIDYHLDLPLSEPDKLALFPHFFDSMKPGWFDKRLSWRKMNPSNIDRTVLVCPSAEFIRELPNAKVPDRTDFVTMSPSERVKIWWNVVDRCRYLADDLAEVLEHDRLAARLEPL
ncbi:MAG: patatin-like phospholipase family protein [Gammaproteobacteria bacterium]|nr:patatin-like phospholipase family protein [Gammaproteobacteria bacterium]MDH4315122.1 patatin-like phospholipase family protein [Gammaproteobacteria bacterium]MDH5214255.1 patatin-like phospholipase family protein [Gammaproteobacteria bacterium]